MINEKLIVAGFGGQGVLMIGKMVALSGIENDLEVSWLPAYGSEMRGGTASCSVNVSEKPIDSPMILKATAVIAMNLPSLRKFEGKLIAGGKLFINSSLVDEEPERTDIQVFKVPFNDLATEAGNERGMNMLVAGVYAAVTGSITLQNLYDAVEHTFTGNKEKFQEGNKKMCRLGFEYAQKNLLDK